MRRIIVDDKKTVSLCDISDNSIVGIKWENGSKSAIISTDKGFCCLSNRYTPNLHSVWYANSVKEYIKRALTQGNNTKSKSFVFDTTFELYEWMGKQ